jgi:hypothetical protein
MFATSVLAAGRVLTRDSTDDDRVRMLRSKHASE